MIWRTVKRKGKGKGKANRRETEPFIFYTKAPEYTSKSQAELSTNQESINHPGYTSTPGSRCHSDHRRITIPSPPSVAIASSLSIPAGVTGPSASAIATEEISLAVSALLVKGKSKTLVVEY
jgi:hypothetical protein